MGDQAFAVTEQYLTRQLGDTEPGPVFWGDSLRLSKQFGLLPTGFTLASEGTSGWQPSDWQLPMCAKGQGYAALQKALAMRTIASTPVDAFDYQSVIVFPDAGTARAFVQQLSAAMQRCPTLDQGPATVSCTRPARSTCSTRAWRSGRCHR